MPLSAAKETYQKIQVKTTETKSQPSYLKDYYQYLSPIWVVNILVDSNMLDLRVPSGEAIMESMNPIEKTWEINHQREHFLSN